MHMSKGKMFKLVVTGLSILSFLVATVIPAYAHTNPIISLLINMIWLWECD